MSYSVAGIDVSAWDPYIDWPLVKSKGIRFCIIKATEGTSFVSGAYASQWDGAKSVGILRGAYHFLRAAQDGAKQADFFLSKVKVEDGDLPPVLDIEEANNAGATRQQFIGNSQKWLERVEQLTGRIPIIYSRPIFLKDNMAGNNLKPPSWASKYPTWLAEYHNSQTPDTQPTQPVGWGDWIIWQYSGDTLTLDGIYRDASRTSLIHVDMNVYRYSIDELYKLAKAKMPANIDVAAPVVVDPSQPSTPVTPPAQPQQPSQPQTPPSQPSAPANAPADSGVTYTVKSGDNLTAIAVKYGVSVDALAQLNNVVNKNIISVGQVLKIPKK